jgi:hypothetical protein
VECLDLFSAAECQSEHAIGEVNLSHGTSSSARTAVFVSSANQVSANQVSETQVFVNQVFVNQVFVNQVFVNQVSESQASEYEARILLALLEPG